MLEGLDMLLTDGPTKRETELRRMQKGKRVVCCTAVYTPVGVDLRLLDDGGISERSGSGIVAFVRARVGRRGCGFFPPRYRPCSV